METEKKLRILHLRDLLQIINVVGVNVVVVRDFFPGSFFLWLCLKCENESFDEKLTTSSFQFSGQNMNSELNGHTNYKKHCFGGFWKILL